VTKPIVQMTGVMQQISKNDLSVTIPGGNRKDEIGAMGSAVNIFKENAQKRDELEKALAKMADSFESNVGSILTSVLNELGTIQEAVKQVSASADSTNSLSTSVVSSSTATAEHVQSVAAAIEHVLQIA
jgi:methyl-accepting chemotaxis protein